MRVSGRAGMGKSALAQAFLDRAEQGGAVVLRGRAYERESLPYKAVDSIIDALSRYLVHLADHGDTFAFPRRRRRARPSLPGPPARARCSIACPRSRWRIRRAPGGAPSVRCARCSASWRGAAA